MRQKLFIPFAFSFVYGWNHALHELHKFKAEKGFYRKFFAETRKFKDLTHYSPPASSRLFCESVTRSNLILLHHPMWNLSVTGDLPRKKKRISPPTSKGLLLMTSNSLNKFFNRQTNQNSFRTSRYVIKQIVCKSHLIQRQFNSWQLPTHWSFTHRLWQWFFFRFPPSLGLCTAFQINEFLWND